jgi:rhodanese-related sulfurtransferase
MEDITIQELHDRRKQGDDLSLIDVREPHEHAEFELGGENLPLGDIHSWMDDLEDSRDEELILYCRTGNRSGIAKAFLESAGFKKVRNLTGGIVAWIEAYGRE